MRSSRHRAILPALTVFFVVVSMTTAFADTIANNLDASIDASLESMTLTAGGSNGTAGLFVTPVSGDGKNGCNLTGSTSLSVSVSSSSTAVATISPTSITFSSCGATPTIAVTPVAAGTTTVSLSQTSNNTGGSFDLAPASFSVTVNPSAPPNAAPNPHSIIGAGTAVEGASEVYTSTATDPDGDPLTYGWSIISGPGTIVGAVDQPSVTVKGTDGPGSVVLHLAVSDDHGHTVSPPDRTISVTNANPAATFSSPGSVSEGSSFTLSLTAPTDPSAADAAAGFTYAFGCGSGLGSYGSANSATCSTTDDAHLSVAGAIRDKDGGITTYATTVNVQNVAPTATFSNDGPVDEGGSATVSLTDPQDPSAADLASLRYAFDCSGGDLSGTTYASASGIDHASCTFGDGPATPVVTGAVLDDDGGITTYATTVTVANVAPTATLSTDGPVDEGGSATVSLTDPQDPSAADLASLRYAFDCSGGDLSGTTYASASGDFDHASCTFDDGPGAPVVSAAVIDRDGGISTFTTTVGVRNVAPTATFSSPGSVPEGDHFTLSLTDPSDPSGADTSSGFGYAFDCGQGLGSYGPSSSASCATTDDASLTVGGSIMDKDGGHTDQTASLQVLNVAPTADLSNDGPIDEGGAVTVSFAHAHDPSPADQASLRYAFDCSGGDLSGASYASASSIDHTSCTFDDGPATHIVTGAVLDDDGGISTISTSVQVRNVAPSADLSNGGPVDEGHGVTVSFAHARDVSPTDEASLRYAFDCAGGDLSAVHYADAGSSDHTSCSFDDGPAEPIVTAAVIDHDGGISTYSTTVHVRNVAPTADLGNDGPIDEGGSATVTFTHPLDPSPADAASLRYVFDCSGGDLSGASYGSASALDHTTCSFDDGPATPSVTGAVIDRDGGISTYSTTVHVRNVAPTADLGNDGPIDEGGSATVTFTHPQDPSPADAATLRYVFDCSGADLSATAYADASSVNHTTCSFDDGPAMRSITGAVIDRDGGVTTYDTTVRVRNVAPTATLSNDGPTSEGSATTISFSDPQDPSSADRASLRYAFDCAGNDLSGVGYADASTVDHATCTFDDGASTPSVTGAVIDKDGGITTYATTVNVQNVAPTATFSNDGPVDEGGSATVSLTDPQDPSAADLASLRYAFDCSGGDLSGTTYASASGIDHASCTFGDGPATPVVTGAVLDDDGGITTYATTVTVANVAPTATLSTDGPVDEGGSATVSLTDPQDPSAADLASLRYAFDCSGGDLSGTTYASASGIDHASCTFDDGPGAPVVSAAVIDRDGGISTFTTTVGVRNVAPTATFSSPGSVPEGDHFTLSLTDPSDPSGADTSSGFGYAFDCGQGLGSYGPSSSASCATTDDASLTVGGSIMDKDGGHTDQTASLQVLNVAPTADLSNDGPIDEGGAVTVSFAHAHDPSPADQASLRYAFDCSGGDLSGASYALASSIDHTSCTFDDGPATHIVTGAVLDDDGGISTISTSVQVRNVAPSATFAAPASVAEGTSIVLSLTGGHDPSGTDTGAGFTYAFDCGDGAGLSAYGPTATRSCPTADDGAVTVIGSVRDKDGGSNQTTRVVQVANVAPSIQGLTVTGSSVTACLGGNTVRVSFSVTDPANEAHDPITGAIAWGDGATASIAGRSISTSHVYPAGSYSMTITVNDGDGGVVTAQVPVSSLYVLSAIQPPVNLDGSSVFKYGSTIPVKVRITDCNGLAVPDVAPRIGTERVSGLAPTDAVNETASTSAADTTGVMRYDGAGQYVYNWASKTVTDGNATYYFYVRGKDASGAFVTGPSQVSTRFGLRTK